MSPKQVKQLQYAEKRMRALWHAMVIADEGGASAVELERMYDAYLLVLEEYLRCYQLSWPAHPAQQDSQDGRLLKAASLGAAWTSLPSEKR